MTFDDLRLVKPLLDAVHSAGYETPTPIQAKAIPLILDGQDVLACAQTGTGKTAAFALPILQRLSARTSAQYKNGRRSGARKIRTLVLAPTRELAQQIADSFGTYGRSSGLRHTVVYGGVNKNAQVRVLRSGVDILVATPGRLLDHMNDGVIKLDSVEILVLDEGDRMLDMGFLPDIRRILRKVPEQRQTLLLSATIPPLIRDLAQSILKNPVSVAVARVSAPTELVEHWAYRVEKKEKPSLLCNVLQHTPYSRALVFTRTKHGADKVVRHLTKAGVAAAAIHGNKSQNARTRALAGFRSGKTGVLVATDIAARGLDIDDISHVINYDLTAEPETYVHRIGRTARAGASGTALSFVSSDDHESLRDIERLIR
ncbi:MAG: DEAD/DEAH box helicase, partial [Planctomycetota bacterium]|nr:DEAD/DEAH box helicase [Planctomycetota bacterium]